MQIHDCVQAGDVEGVLRQLELGVEVDQRDPDEGRTPLMVAVTSEGAGLEMVRLLLEHGADVNAIEPEHNSTVLALAVKNGTLAQVDLLLETGADIHYHREGGYDVLIDAMHSEAMVEKEPLLPLVELLLSYGAPTQGESDYGESALSVASHLGRFDVVAHLLEAGADARVVEWNELMRAIALGSVREVERLLGEGADLMAVDRWERTPWLLSLQTGELDKARLLFATGADPNARGHCGQTPLMHAIESDQAEVVSYLIAQGADLDAKDEFGNTALMRACEQGATECVRRLLKAGARADLTDVTDAPQKDLRTQLQEIDPSLGQSLTDEMLARFDDYAGEKAIAKAANLDIVRLLLQAGEDLGDISNEMRAELTGLEGEGELHCSLEEYEQGKRRRFGTSNPEVMNIPFWTAMVRSGVAAYTARAKFDDTSFAALDETVEDKGEESRVETGPVWCFEEGPTARRPVWCFHRFGKSITELPDGRIIEIGGEHEDFYDPDFCIYNEVFVHHGGGRFDILGYPATVFPPTDFHSATLVGNFIYIIGCLGYPQARVSGETPVYRLACDSLSIEKVETSGEKPGWSSGHKAFHRSSGSPAGEICLSGGKVCEVVEGKEEYFDNVNSYVLDLGSLKWSRVGAERDIQKQP